MKIIKPKDIKRNWHLVDAKGARLGRLSTRVAEILMGKTKPIYTPNLDTGDYVVIVNAKEIELSGKKENQKVYYRHSGFPGGLYKRTAKEQRSIHPEEIVKNSIYGMLPKTKMGKTMMKKLYVFASADHPYQSKFKKES